MDKYVNIYNSNFLNNVSIKKNNKVIVFDIDETLGSFTEIDILWNELIKIDNKLMNVYFFNQLLDIYPEFLRYGIINILHFIYNKKKIGECYKLFIYTNNKSINSLVDYILQYFNYKLNSMENIFDKVIYSFKINNKNIDLRRTTISKTYNDLIRCVKIPETTEICFIDNTYFPKMSNKFIYYIQPISYYHNLTNREIVERFMNSTVYKTIGFSIEYHYLISFFKNEKLFIHNKLNKLKTDIYVSKKILYHIKEFFHYNNYRNIKTVKKNIRIGRFTRKNK
jgi:hypothetical protein